MRHVPMRSDPKYPLQLRRLTVQVENVLKGAPVPPTLAVYYFIGLAASIPRPWYWTIGNRRILWLRRDSGVLRTACDGWDDCTEAVWSGARPHYLPDVQKPIEFAMVDSSTRGEGIKRDSLRYRSIPRRTRENSGASSIRGAKTEAACLDGTRRRKIQCMFGASDLYGGQSATGDSSTTRNAIQSAHCRCTEKPDGNVVCQ